MAAQGLDLDECVAGVELAADVVMEHYGAGDWELRAEPLPGVVAMARARIAGRYLRQELGQALADRAVTMVEMKDLIFLAIRIVRDAVAGDRVLGSDALAEDAGRAAYAAYRERVGGARGSGLIRDEASRAARQGARDNGEEVCGMPNKTVDYNDGSRYVGEWRDGKRHGQGVYVWKGGLLYVGEFFAGQPHGFGAFRWPSGEEYIKYVGDVCAGVEHGRGVYEWPSGERYAGDVRDGKPHGVGVRTFRDGARYEGGFREGRRHGEGVYTWAEGRRYEGQWRDGQPTGLGVFEGAPRAGAGLPVPAPDGRAPRILH